ncbi:MAG: hypothetical protein FWC70_04875 [Defluviitaleaceae bacterium]|nr:hypothetical protein [Defluviitaleaceae bacterium]
MLDFKEEIAKYKPVRLVDDVETAVKKDELLDIMGLLQYLTGKAASAGGDDLELS